MFLEWELHNYFTFGEDSYKVREVEMLLNKVPNQEIH